MSTRCLDTDSRAPLSRSAAISATDVLERAAGTLLTWLQRDRDRRALLALDDRLLQDIGVSRYDVDREVGKPFWRG